MHDCILPWLLISVVAGVNGAGLCRMHGSPCLLGESCVFGFGKGGFDAIS